MRFLQTESTFNKGSEGVGTLKKKLHSTTEFSVLTAPNCCSITLRLSSLLTLMETSIHVRLRKYLTSTNFACACYG